MGNDTPQEHIRRLEDEAKESEVVFEKERLAHRQAVEVRFTTLHLFLRVFFLGETAGTAY